MEIENQTTSAKASSVQEAHFRIVLDKVINPARTSRKPAYYFPCCRVWNKRQPPTLSKETPEEVLEQERGHIGKQFTTWAMFGKGEEPLNYHEAWEKFKVWVSTNQIPNDFNMPFIINQQECIMRDVVIVTQEPEDQGHPVPSKNCLPKTCPTLRELDELKLKYRRLEVDMNCTKWTYKDIKARISRIIKRRDKFVKAMNAQLEIRDGVIKEMLIALNDVTQKYEGRRINEWKYKEKVYKGLIEFTNGQKEFDDSESLSSDTYGSIDSPRD